MASSDAEDILRGKTLDVYRYVLKNRRPSGVREVQRALKFSSPRLATLPSEQIGGSRSFEKECGWLHFGACCSSEFGSFEEAIDSSVFFLFDVFYNCVDY